MKESHEKLRELEIEKKGRPQSREEWSPLQIESARTRNYSRWLHVILPAAFAFLGYLFERNVMRELSLLVEEKICVYGDERRASVKRGDSERPLIIYPVGILKKVQV